MIQRAPVLAELAEYDYKISSWSFCITSRLGRRTAKVVLWGWKHQATGYKLLFECANIVMIYQESIRVFFDQQLADPLSRKRLLRHNHISQVW